MSREIKFRAWVPSMEQMGFVTNLQGSNKDFLFPQIVVEIFPNRNQVFYQTDEFVLMQFTGLKDKNGVEIYEHDLVRIEEDFGESDFKYKVEFLGGSWMAISTTSAYVEYELAKFQKWLVVIGSVHQSPNLLNQE